MIIDLQKKIKELQRQVELLTNEVSDLIKRKGQLELLIKDLDIKTNQKMQVLKQITEEVRNLNENITKVKSDLQEYRRSEIQSTAEEVEKMRSQGV